MALTCSLEDAEENADDVPGKRLQENGERVATSMKMDKIEDGETCSFGLAQRS